MVEEKSDSMSNFFHRFFVSLEFRPELRQGWRLEGMVDAGLHPQVPGAVQVHRRSVRQLFLGPGQRIPRMCSVCFSCLQAMIKPNPAQCPNLPLPAYLTPLPTDISHPSARCSRHDFSLFVLFLGFLSPPHTRHCCVGNLRWCQVEQCLLSPTHPED